MKTPLWRSECVVRKWHALSQRRCKHMLDLQASGRWRIYYGEAEFRAHLDQVKRDVEVWANMVADPDGVKITTQTLANRKSEARRLRIKESIMRPLAGSKLAASQDNVDRDAPSGEGRRYPESRGQEPVDRAAGTSVDRTRADFKRLLDDLPRRPIQAA